MNSDDLPLFAQLDPPAKPAGNTPFGAASERSGSQNAPAITVSELNRRVKGLLEANLELRWVRGELSNVVRAASGHWYFVLKDDAAQVRCVMFRSRAQTVSFTPENGLDVEVRALPSLYEARGEFQLGVESMRRAGMGALFEAFERLKRKLAAEGLFDAEAKRALPDFPRVVGIVTSTKAAALRDVLTTFKRRAPAIRIVIYPTAVQGADAGREIALAIDAARERQQKDSLDALLICRGGGSMEDLWSFNEEVVARAMHRFQSETDVPVVSGVGHETDFTICDFVADVRAPTPTAAAELLSPDMPQLRANVQAMALQMRRTMLRALRERQQHLDFAARGLVSPAERILRERETLTRQRQALVRALHARRSVLANTLAHTSARVMRAKPDVSALRASLERTSTDLRDALQRHLREQVAQLQQHQRALIHLNPEDVLTRGYAIVSARGDGNALVTRASALNAGDEVTIRLQDGTRDALIAGAASDSTKSSPK
jgi:exodeoxyribonuclease VII large subunit